MLLPATATEWLSCVSGVFVEWGPLRFGFPLRVFKASKEQSSVCAGDGLHQQAEEFVGKTNREVCRLFQTVHRLCVHGISHRFPQFWMYFISLPFWVQLLSVPVGYFIIYTSWHHQGVALWWLLKAVLSTRKALLLASRYSKCKCIHW